MAAAGIGLQCLSALLIAAHFLRSGQIVLATFCLLAPLLFLYRRRASLVAVLMLHGESIRAKSPKH